MAPDAQQPDLPSAQRVIGADIAEVYAVLAEPRTWHTWIDGVAPPVKDLGGDVFEVTNTDEGSTRTHRVVVTARGPVHTLFTEVDDAYRVEFRTRPDLGGTAVHVVATPIGKPKWWQGWFRRRATPDRQSKQLKDLLAQLANHFEQRRA
jgi:hypothetical protein